jgi:hypothetical protein
LDALREYDQNDLRARCCVCLKQQLGAVRSDYGADGELRAAHLFAFPVNVVRSASLAGVSKGWHERPWRSTIVSSGRGPVWARNTKM